LLVIGWGKEGMRVRSHKGLLWEEGKGWADGVVCRGAWGGGRGAFVFSRL